MSPVGGNTADGRVPDRRQASRDQIFDDEVSELYRQHADMLGRYLHAMCGDQSTAEEVCHDAILVVRRNWERVRDGSSPRAYLYKVAVSLLRRVLKQRAPEVPHEDPPDRETPDETETRVVEAAEAMTLVRQLSRREREVVVLRVMCDLSEAETAQVLQIRVGTVKNYLSLGLKRLRELTKDDAPFGADIPRGRKP